MAIAQPEIKTTISFVKKALKHHGSPAGASLLEVGCDEGHFASALALEGYDVTGIDRSAEKISVALQQEHDHLHFYTHDVRLPFHINYFDFAINILSDFAIFKKEREQYNAIRSIANALKHQGVLLLDYYNSNVTAEEYNIPRLSLGDFNDMFAFHHLQMQEVYGDYDLNAYDLKKSPRLIMIAKKK